MTPGAFPTMPFIRFVATIREAFGWGHSSAVSIIIIPNMIFFKNFSPDSHEALSKGMPSAKLWKIHISNFGWEQKITVYVYGTEAMAFSARLPSFPACLIPTFMVSRWSATVCSWAPSTGDWTSSTLLPVKLYDISTQTTHTGGLATISYFISIARDKDACYWLRRGDFANFFPARTGSSC